MADLFVRDINEGIADTGIKAGVIKCATDEPGVTPAVEQVLRCCARRIAKPACRSPRTRTPATKRGLEQQEIFKEEGVDLTRVVIGHSGDTDDSRYLEELIANGSILGMDRFGIDGCCPTEKRVAADRRSCASAVTPTAWC